MQSVVPLGTAASYLCQHGGLFECKTQNRQILGNQHYHTAMAAETDKVEPADSEQDEEEDVYEVEKIIDMRVEEVKIAKCYVAAWLALQTWLAFLSVHFHEA